MKRVFKIVAVMLTMCVLFAMTLIETKAASGTISISSKQVDVGSNATISCTIKCTTGPIGSADVVLTYDQSALQFVSATNNATGGNGSVKYVGVTPNGTDTSLSFNMTFNVLKAGAHRISVSNAEVYDYDEILFSPSGSGTITGKTSTSSGGGSSTGSGSGSGGNTSTTKKDTNNKLGDLKVYPGSLSPAFNAATTSYKITVPEETTEVTISATPQSDKATVTVSGGKDLKLGLNTAQVVVVAESGSSRAYTITIMCGEKEQISIDGTTKTIHEDFTDEQIPTGFARTKVTYNKRQYEALVNAAGNMYLMSLENEEGASYYIYNSKAQEFFTFIQIIIAEGKYIIPLSLSKEITQFQNNDIVTLTVDGKNFDAWKVDDEFSVAYVMNQDGKEVLYRYDSVDGVFQRYTEETLKVTEDVKKSLFPDKYYMYAIIGLGALCLILTVAMIYFIASRNARKEGRKKKLQRDMEKEQKRQEKALEREHRREEKALEKQRRLEEKELARQNREGGSRVLMALLIILVSVVLIATIMVVLGFFGIGLDFEAIWEQVKNMF